MTTVYDTVADRLIETNRGVGVALFAPKKTAAPEKYPFTELRQKREETARRQRFTELKTRGLERTPEERKEYLRLQRALRREQGFMERFTHQPVEPMLPQVSQPEALPQFRAMQPGEPEGIPVPPATEAEMLQAMKEYERMVGAPVFPELAKPYYQRADIPLYEKIMETIFAPFTMQGAAVAAPFLDQKARGLGVPGEYEPSNLPGMMGRYREQVPVPLQMAAELPSTMLLPGAMGLKAGLPQLGAPGKIGAKVLAPVAKLEELAGKAAAEAIKTPRAIARTYKSGIEKAYGGQMPPGHVTAGLGTGSGMPPTLRTGPTAGMPVRPLEMPPALPSGRVQGGPQNIKPYKPLDDYERVVDALTPEKSTAGAWLKKGYDKAMEHMYDRNWVLVGLENKTGIPTHKLAQVVPGATAAGENNLRKFVKPIIDGVGKDLPELEQYMVIQRCKDILAKNPHASLPGGVSGWSGTLAAEKTLAGKLGSVRLGQVEEAAQKMWRSNDDLVLQPMLREGLIDDATYAALKSTHPHYIPFHRADFSISDEIANTFIKPEASISSTGIKRMTYGGSARKLEEPLAQLQAEVVKTQSNIFRNRASRSIHKALLAEEELTGEKVTRIITGAQPGERSKLKGVISYFEGGKKVSVEVPAEYARAATAAEWEVGNVVTRMISRSNDVLRKGAVSYNPAFLLVNPVRDMWSAWYREGMIPLGKDYIRGWLGVFKKNATYDEAANAGTFLSGIADTIRATDPVKRAKMGIGGIAVKDAKDAALVIPRLIERANTTAEQATRLGVYTKGRRTGHSQLESAIMSRDATVDFAKAGTSMRVINQVLVFSNAGLQGTANTLRLMRSNPKAAVARSAPFWAASMLAHVNNQRFETYSKIAEYEFGPNWIIQFGEYEDREGEKKPAYIKIPKGPLGSLLSYPAELGMRWGDITEDKSYMELLWEKGQEAGKIASPVDPQLSGFLPPLAKTAASLQSGRNLYSGLDIVPRGEQYLLPEQQFDADTSDIAVALGQKTGVSPRMLEFAVRDYTAGAGELGLWVGDMALNALGYEPEVYGEALDIHPTSMEATQKTPVVRRFLGTRGSREERAGWDKFNKISEETNRAFSQIPEVNKLGVKLSNAGSSLNNVDLEPEQRARYQEIIAEIVIPGIREVVSSNEYKSLQPEAGRDLVMSSMSKLKAWAREKFAQEVGIPIDGTSLGTQGWEKTIDGTSLGTQGWEKTIYGQAEPKAQENIRKWEDFKKNANSRVLLVLNGIWFKQEKLTNPAMIEQLKKLHKEFSFGEKDFTIWYKQILRQVWENASRSKQAAGESYEYRGGN